MHKTASINIQPIKPNSEIHNQRKGKKLDYVHYDRTQQNKFIIYNEISEYKNHLEKLVKQKTGRTMQSKATPIREGVLNLNDENNLNDLKKLANRLEELFGMKTLQIYIHEDEGRYENEVFIQNRHAHMVFSFINIETGKSLALKPHHMCEMQDIVAEVLKMERGQTSNKKHLNAIQYKRQQEEKKLLEAEAKLTEIQSASKKSIEELNTAKTEYKILNNKEKLKETGIAVLSTITGGKDRKISQLGKQIELNEKLIESLRIDNEAIKTKLEIEINVKNELKAKNSDLANHLSRAESSQRFTLYELEKVKKERDQMKQQLSELTKYIKRMKGVIINWFIKKDINAHEVIIKMADSFNKNPKESLIYQESVKKNKGLRLG